MTKPILDPRTHEDIMELIKRRAWEYVPEWRYTPGDEKDPGAAIAALFGEMFYHTVDRYNLLPEKYYTEFLNLLGVASPTLTPAAGLVQFEAAAGTEGEPVAVPADTEVFATNGEGEQIVYATERKIEATTARLADVYYADPQQGRIEKLDMALEQPFFAPAGSKNLQYHRFAIAHNEALALSGPCTVEVSVRQSTRFLEEGTAKLLAEPASATWKYFDGTEYVPFDAARAEGATVVLEKKSAASLFPEEDGNRYLYCDMEPSLTGAITLAGVSLKTALASPVPADALSNNDIPIRQGEGGYCFGRRPAPYELFYFRSDNVLCKRGAQANIQLHIVPVVYSESDREPQYAFTKSIIDKNEAVRTLLEDVFVEQVVWEYYNGEGWAKLAVSGNVNPFSCKEQGETALFFTIPADMEPVSVNAEEGYYVRARVVHVENFFSTVPRWILPFVKAAACTFQYTRQVPAQALRAQNNAKTVELGNAAGVNDLHLTVFEPMAQHPRAMYLRFDESPHAMPLSLLFEILGEAPPSSKIVYEMWRGGFVQARCIDNTDNLRYTGCAYLYLPEPLEETEFFGVSGYWLRMSLSGPPRPDRLAPRVGSVRLNIVNAVQRQKALPQAFDTGTYEADKTLVLMESPVLACSVWVDEINGLSETDIAELEKEPPDSVRVERDGNKAARCLVRWQQVPVLEQAAAGARAYELDSYVGRIRFGNGRAGKVPPPGEGNIRVEYSYGGGTRGNMPEGSVNALVGSIARISGVKNITPMSGGTDRPAIAKVEALGNRFLRHRERALSTADFEEMTLSRFERAAHVKCFPNTDERGVSAPGHVCVVVMGRDLSGEYMVHELCREVYAYLSAHCDCNLAAGGRLHVVPSTEITVSAHVRVQLRDLDQAALSQQQIIDGITHLISAQWRAREIGEQISLPELYQAVKAVRNVTAVRQILCEGSYFEQGRRVLCALDDGRAFPFATVRSGTHTVRVE